MNRRFLLAILLLAVVGLACSVPAGMPTVTATAVPTVQKPLQKQPTVPTKAMPTVFVTAYQSLHVRTARMGIVIDYLYHGNQVTLTGTCDDGWAEIVWEDAPGGSAWVNADFLSKNKCSEEK